MIELTIEPAETWVLQDVADDLIVADAEPKLARAFIEGRVGHQLLQHLTIEPEGACLFRRNRAPDLTLQLLQLVIVGLAELIGGDFHASNRRHCLSSTAAKDVGDAPDTESDDQKADDGRHHDLAEPT